MGGFNSPERQRYLIATLLENGGEMIPFPGERFIRAEQQPGGSEVAKVAETEGIVTRERQGNYVVRIKLNYEHPKVVELQTTGWQEILKAGYPAPVPRPKRTPLTTKPQNGSVNKTDSDITLLMSLVFPNGIPLAQYTRAVSWITITQELLDDRE